MISGKPPRILRGPDADRHPAAEAWRARANGRTASAGPTVVEIWRERPGHQPASVYRLVFRGGALPAVFAKRCDRGSAPTERLCYEEILPGLDMPSPAYHGSLEAADGSWWFFLEDVGRRRFSAHDPRHRSLAARWLGRLHRLGAGSEGARRLPSAGPARYIAHLRAGRDRIRTNFGNRALTPGDRDLLAQVLAALDRAESRWATLERACATFPETLVHGDFRPKNVRVREEPGGLALHVFDWELAGWGVPAADLAPARGAIGACPVDLDEYARELADLGAGLHTADLRRLCDLGHLFRRLAAIDWETMHLAFEDPECLLGPVASLRVLHRALSRGLTRTERWLA